MWHKLTCLTFCILYIGTHLQAENALSSYKTFRVKLQSAHDRRLAAQRPLLSLGKCGIAKPRLPVGSPRLLLTLPANVTPLRVQVKCSCQDPLDDFTPYGLWPAQGLWLHRVSSVQNVKYCRSTPLCVRAMTTTLQENQDKPVHT